VRNGSADRVNFIWSVADLLRGDYKQSEYGKVILPLVVIRRLDCVLEPTKEKVLAEYAELKGRISNVEPILLAASGESFYNTSPLTFQKLLDDPERIADNLRAYINGFSPGALEVITHFGFDTQISTLDKAGLLYLVIGKFADIDLHPEVVSNHDMGYIFEELIRRFSEQSNETAGEHFTPRDVIEIMVNLLFATDEEALSVPGARRTLYDPTAGTGGMLSVAETYLRRLNPDAQLIVFGQELNPDSYAICRSDMMLKGQDPTHIALGNTLTHDAFRDEKFAYMLSNPPFGVDWKKYEKPVRDEAATLGKDGRFGVGLPRINDGSFLFLQHMISKMRSPEDGGSRIAIVFNGSPLFTGDAGSGESEIRRWIIENDWLDAIVALPDQLFYNTGIFTYFWIVTNRKAPERRGKIQLIDARELYEKMPKSLGNKRNRLGERHIRAIVDAYRSSAESGFAKVVENDTFAYLRLTVERPLRLRWQVTELGLEELAHSKPFLALGLANGDGSADRFHAAEESQQRLLDALASITEPATTDSESFERTIDRALEVANVKATGALKKAMWSAFAQSDPSAPVVLQKGKPTPDPDLRDYEQVPFGQDPDEYIKREVLPYASDAWVDGKKTRIGYEIPFTRLFYKYEPPRPLADLESDLDRIVDELNTLLAARARS
jgi:type I restriction enzyme M protein